MKRMGIEALYRKPNTSKPAPGHKIYPYLLRKLPVTRPNQVWAMDITYIPMARGFIYLAAVVDWFTRRVLAWRVSITLEVDFCIEAVEEALARHGAPDIFNSDQGSQFTSTDFIKVLAAREIRISMDGNSSNPSRASRLIFPRPTSRRVRPPKGYRRATWFSRRSPPRCCRHSTIPTRQRLVLLCASCACRSTRPSTIRSFRYRRVRPRLAVVATAPGLIVISAS